MVYHPTSRVLGLGFGERDVRTVLDEVEDFYQSYQLPVQLGQELRARGYLPYYYVGVFVADLKEIAGQAQQLLANRSAVIEV